MKEQNSKKKENSTNYQIDHPLGVTIWKSLFESGNKELAKILSKTMKEFNRKL